MSFCLLLSLRCRELIHLLVHSLQGRKGDWVKVGRLTPEVPQRALYLRLTPLREVHDIVIFRKVTAAPDQRARDGRREVGRQRPLQLTGTENSLGAGSILGVVELIVDGLVFLRRRGDGAVGVELEAAAEAGGVVLGWGRGKD